MWLKKKITGSHSIQGAFCTSEIWWKLLNKLNVSDLCQILNIPYSERSECSYLELCTLCHNRVETYFPFYQVKFIGFSIINPLFCRFYFTKTFLENCFDLKSIKREYHLFEFKLRQKNEGNENDIFLSLEKEWVHQNPAEEITSLKTMRENL